MILEEETYKRFGYYSRALAVKSNKHIVAKCDDCGAIRILPKCAYRALCICCSQKQRWFNYCNLKQKSICQICGTIFFVVPSQIKRGRGKYCSRKCSGIARSKHFKGKNHYNWKGGLIERECQECKKVFYVKPSHIKRGGGLFCYYKCMGVKFSLIHKGKGHPNWKGGLIEQQCQECGRIFLIKPSILKSGGGIFCSYKCKYLALSKNNTGENNHNWKGGISFEPYCIKFNNAFKEYIRTKFGNVCFLCGKTEEENGQGLSIHHVNYQKSCGCADTEEDKKADNKTCQFVPLCISCNTRVNFNRDMWEQRIKNKMKNKLNGWFI